MYLETKGLTKTFGKQIAVDHLDLAVKKQFYSDIRPNGKSTTIAMLLGILSPTSGTISYQTKNTSRSFQESILDDELTVSENLRFRQKRD